MSRFPGHSGLTRLDALDQASHRIGRGGGTVQNRLLLKIQLRRSGTEIEHEDDEH